MKKIFYAVLAALLLVSTADPTCLAINLGKDLSKMEKGFNSDVKKVTHSGKTASKHWHKGLKKMKPKWKPSFKNPLKKL